MKTRPLSQTGFHVSCLALGTLRYGTLNTYAESAELMDIYFDAGGRFIDTANSYNQWCPGGKGGESEVTIGRWMREGNNRDQLFLASKVGFGYPGVDDGLKAATIISECEGSLRRLGTDHLDLYYAHKDDVHTPLAETLEAFHRLVQSGKVRLVGASNYQAWRLADADAMCDRYGWPRFACVEQRYTYLRPVPGADFSPQRLIDDNLSRYCQSRGLTMLPYTPLLRGAYVRSDKVIPRSYQGPDTGARLRALHQVAQEQQATPLQIVLAWMMQRQPPLLPIFSADTPAHMRENLKALDIQLTPAQLTRLETAGNVPNEDPQE
jgi:aryl-alcohol dehydrogenase-like predicted oxidoreductase